MTAHDPGPADPATRSRPNWLRGLAIAIPVIVLLAVATIACFPWNSIRGLIERRLAAASGRSVSIGHIAALNRFTLRPTLQLDQVVIGQPDWAGPGAMARIAQARVSLPILPLLTGQLHLDRLELNGVALALRRDASGRDNWTFGPPRGGGHAAPDRVIIRRGTIDALDVRRHMHLHGRIAADPAGGFIINASGTHRGFPLTFSFRGPTIGAGTLGKAYPFTTRLTSPLLDVAVVGRMDHPLDLHHWRGTLRARGTSADILDDILQVGLPATQPVALTGTVRRDNTTWYAATPAGSLGRSRMAAALVVRLAGDRIILTAGVHASAFDFDSLSSTAQLTAAIAQQRAIGRRIVPETPIHLDHFSHTDGTLRFTATHLLVPPGTPFTNLAATARLDHRRLTIAPLHAGLIHGSVDGTASVDGRSDQPLLRLDLRLRRARMADVFAMQRQLDGPLAGHVVLAGPGRTIREALARSSGRIGLASTGGVMAKRIAVFASGDLLHSAGEAIGGDRGQTVHVRCLVADYNVTSGQLRPAPLVIDTDLARIDGTGSIDLDGERLALTLHGSVKRGALLQFHPSIFVSGTLARPAVTVAGPGQAHGLLGTVGAVLGRMHVGDRRDRPAPDAPCERLVKSALR